MRESISLEEIEKMWETDRKMFRDKLSEHNLDIPNLHGRYMTVYNTERIFRKNLDLKKTILVFNKKDLLGFQEGKNLWISKINQLKKLKNISISCVKDAKNINILIKLNNFISKNLLTIDTSKNDDYFFSEERQINIVQKIIVHIKNSLNNLEDLEIAVNYLNQAINLLDELFGKNDYEDRLGYVFDKFCIGK